MRTATAGSGSSSWGPAGPRNGRSSTAVRTASFAPQGPSGSSDSTSTKQATTGTSSRRAATSATPEPRPATDVSCRSMSVDQARVVVIGGGITGCSVAYHLALAGWADVLLVEKAVLTAWSTCQAAGLVTAFNPSSTMMAFHRYSIELYRSLGAFETVGSLRLPSSPEQLRELERPASRARGIGLEAEVIGAEEARSLMPAISRDNLYGAVHLAGDGHLDPHGATHAVADAARALGVRIRAGV